MDATVVGAIAVTISGFAAAVVAVLRSPGDRESLAVKTQKDVIADMALLVDELVEALQRCRDRRAHLEQEVDAVRAQQARLEKRLRELGHQP